MDPQFKQQLQIWHDTDEYEKIIEAITALPEDERDYDMIGQLARAYNNDGRYAEGAAELEKIREQGADDPLWHFRMGYSLYFLDQFEESAGHFEQAVLREPEDSDAWLFLASCCRSAGMNERFWEASERLRILSPEEWQQHFGSVNPLPEREKTNRSSKAGRSRNLKDPREAQTAELYTQEELDRLEAHITAQFGNFESVFHEIHSPDIHVDIAVIPPEGQRDFYTLVTMGMGAHRMAVPEECREERLDRAEMVLCLPADWKLDNSDEGWYWPLRWMKLLARLPGEENSWLGWGHTIANGGPFAENTALSGMLLLTPDHFGEEAALCEMPDDSAVRFYQMFPIYEEEMEYKLSHGADDLIARLDKHPSPVLDLQRDNVCGHRNPKPKF